jgi:serine phosphatase RsbU (regulator of sigma subunit)
MLALADGQLDAPLPEHSRRDEIGEMADTLRVFKANAIRRERLQAERLSLLEKLQGAYRQLEADLKAASAVQLALLPAPARIGGVTFSGQLRPSHFISGDSYDVLRQPNGSVHFFLADVAGHGAAAALVSVAARYTMTEAILRRSAGQSLAETVAGLNENWPEHLTYFTMVLGELRPEAGQGVLIQAGHPPPLLLRRSGVVEPLGTGGLPIGVIAKASFEEIAFTFELGDRLLVYSDGLTEAENDAGEPFSEERLADLLQAHALATTAELLSLIPLTVQTWRGMAEPEDDMTLLILEAGDEDAPPHMPL